MRLYKRCKCGRGKNLAERKRLWRRCPHDYSFSFKLHGNKETGHTGTRDPEAAATEARRQRVAIEQEAGSGGRRRRTVVPLDTLEAIDLARVDNKGFAERRRKDMERMWKPIFRHLGGPTRDIMTLTEAELDGYPGKRRKDPGHGRGVRGQTIRREMQALERTMKLALRDRLITLMPVTWDLVAPIESDDPDEKQASKPWADAEIRKALSSLSKKALRAGILDLMEFAAETGLRLEELKRYERATWLRGRELYVPASGAKTGSSGKRIIALRRRALALAKKWPRFNVRKPHKALKLACEKAGFEKVLTPRDLRAHRITDWAKRSPLAAQRLAGHTSLATTSRYLHPDAELIRKTALAGEKPRKARGGGARRGYTNRGSRNSVMKSARARSSAG